MIYYNELTKLNNNEKNILQVLAKQDCFQHIHDNYINAHANTVYTNKFIQNIHVIYINTVSNKVDTNISAFCLVTSFDYTNDQYYFIHTLCVSNLHRNKRLCSKLITTAVELLSPSKVPIILDVLTNPPNTLAIQCYTKAGFKFIPGTTFKDNNELFQKMIYSVP